MNQSSGLLNIHYLLDLLDGNIIATGTIVVRCTYIYNSLYQCNCTAYNNCKERGKSFAEIFAVR